VLGFSFFEDFKHIECSDVDPDITRVASLNLGLLGHKGLHLREKELIDLYREFNKTSHKKSLEGIQRLKMRIAPTSLESRVFTYNILSNPPLSLEKQPDIIFTDVPYGNHSHWQGNHAHLSFS
jgi:RRNA methyltransferase AviRa